MSTRPSRRARFWIDKVSDSNEYFNLFASLFCNSVKINNLEHDTKQSYIMKILLERGTIARDKITGLWGQWSGEGSRYDGEPETVRIWFKNGNTIEGRKRSDVEIYDANPMRQGVASWLTAKCELLQEFDEAIYQNLQGSKQAVSIITNDKMLLRDIENANNQREMGASTVYFTSEMLSSNSISALKTGVDYLTDNLLRDRQTVFNSVLAVLGTTTGLSEKKERIQATEIDSANGFANDCIGILVDTFNQCAVEEGSNVEMVVNNLCVLAVPEAQASNKEILQNGQNNENV